MAAGKSKHSLSEGCPPPCSPNGVVQQPNFLWIVRYFLPQQFQTAKDRHQKIVEVVRYSAGELADGIHFLRLEQRFPGLLQFFLGLRTLRDILSYFGKPQYFTGIIADRVNHNVRSKRRSIFADT